MIDRTDVGAVVDEMYATISGPAGPRDWLRQKVVFHDDSRQIRTWIDAAGKPTLNDPKNIEALDFYLTLARNGKLETQKELDQLFLQGRVAFWMSGPWLVDRIAQENPSLNYKVIPMPSLNGKPVPSSASTPLKDQSAQS